jgi:hypothetical protein
MNRLFYTTPTRFIHSAPRFSAVRAYTGLDYD